MKELLKMIGLNMSKKFQLKLMSHYLLGIPLELEYNQSCMVSVLLQKVICLSVIVHW